MYTVSPVNHTLDSEIHSRIDHKTKPLGALGELETLALQLARIQLTKASDKLALNKPTMLVFAGDHGVADYGVSIGGSEITAQMVQNFINGGAAINVFCRQNNMALEVIDCGMKTQLDDPRIINQRLGNGTKAMHKEAAMSINTVHQGFAFARELVQRHVNNGCNLLAIGEMGIGNTTAAAAVMAALTGIPVAECTGKGTGIDIVALKRKRIIIEQALLEHYSHLTNPIQILACLGGFEIVQMTGTILAAAEFGVPVLVDGFIASVAALAAVELAPAVRDYLIFSHESDENGHRRLLLRLNARPMLRLGLRLGEGTGAALALPLLQAAVAFYNDMASFAEAGVTSVVEPVVNSGAA
ncbi:nicotinate-nucleotide--dimethylbenzimidazole phosphoribosyltransferase [Shewanella sp. C32]|uniref:Nicotinate-nucleotide--dimethylbenzimidazole phosphoribosyltransferase n=1 Tax=Shewanella electrica TaxID=515560 RepID=A0ABT2FMD0_9GAMM|nr:nicotinate-nucleotide--dimethylbenzimidazole phosphoribosyltransferase [Shewanella electrica]MCH1925576.1 nicotinate-nucleotide--dimethylbenzimidazole phosphoribosyltransferase [Shewanella electrica]MCS4557117.1 nicotinate-nucleotide--dimethylbenzimidazole phosphoribosyltransferase [Shewanella electrica]